MGGGRRGGRGCWEAGQAALCFAAEATVRIAAAVTAESAEWEVAVSPRSLWDQERPVGPGFCPGFCPGPGL